MNKPARKKATGRRGADQVLKIVVDPDAINARIRSPEMERVTKALSEGREVQLMPKVMPLAREGIAKRLASSNNLLKTSRVVTMVTGGTALGLASLAVAPASLIAAFLSAGVGAIIGNVATRLDDSPTKSHSTKAGRVKDR